MPLQFLPQRRCCPTCRNVFCKSLDRCPRDRSLLVSLPQDPLVGTTIEDLYEVHSVLAVGRRGCLYRALGSEGQEVTIKTLYGEFAAQREARHHFLRAASAASTVRHPNVVTVFDYGETARGTPYLARESLAGALLSDRIREHAPFDSARVVSILGELCLGLEAIHEKGVVHRDLTASNLMMCTEGGRETLKILDSASAIPAKLDHAEAVRGSLRQAARTHHIAPEMVTSANCDARADLYGVGVILYRMLCGVFPYESPFLRLLPNRDTRAHIGLRVPGLEVDPRLEAIAMRLIATNPTDRFQSASAVIAALAALSMS